MMIGYVMLDGWVSGVRGGHPKFSRKSQTFAKLKNSRHQINGARREEGGNFHTSLYIFRMSILASLWLKTIEKVAKMGMSEQSRTSLRSGSKIVNEIFLHIFKNCDLYFFSLEYQSIEK